MIIWHDILFAINMVSKNLQAKSNCIDSAMKQVEGVIVYMAIASLKSKIVEMRTFETVFGFLYNSVKLKSLDAIELRERCTTFYNTFFHSGSSDVTLHDEVMAPIEILEFVNTIGCYPNIFIAYRILLTTLATVASMERNFSKLKLLKNYLRSSMS
ncbi:putative HAT dimerization domain-containing protein [Arabidopsis thaliana]